MFPHFTGNVTGKFRLCNISDGSWTAALFEVGPLRCWRFFAQGHDLKVWEVGGWTAALLEVGSWNKKSSEGVGALVCLLVIESVLIKLSDNYSKAEVV